VIYPGAVVYTFDALGHVGAITAINPRTHIRAAIPDAPTDGTTYSSRRRRSYNFDLRRALEQSTTADEIANALAAKIKDYAFGHLILLADAQRTHS
jgi:Flp pilus assembly CpaF family ATPase